MKNIHYVYALLDPMINSKKSYEDTHFKYEPFYIGIGVGARCNSHTTKSSLRVVGEILLKHRIRSLISTKTVYLDSEGSTPISEDLREELSNRIKSLILEYVV